ncbi:MAG: 16S rRNA (guanine(527)-N(7))-methyltransferase RsmG [Acidobacteria bacterium]|nr:16S rRNA (guanine(527)-N(7))-methyltransferase RsmG [Acidobacteriota bacterium]
MTLISLAPEKKEKLENYLDLLFSYNKKFNLTSFKSKEEAWEKGICPLLKILEYAEGGKCLDIGSGSGIPAIPLSILCEKSEWILLEPSQKKAGFLIKVSLSLGLRNKVVAQRAEEFFKQEKNMFSLITCRGVRLNSRILHAGRERLSSSGAFVVFTGKEKVDDYCSLFRKNDFALNAKIEDAFSVILVNVPRGTKQ